MSLDKKPTIHTNTFWSIFRTWIELLKPRVSSLVLVTALPGMIFPGKTDLILIITTLTGTFFMSSASFIFNQYIERKKDAKMNRTRHRPIPSGRISPNEALIGGFFLTGSAFYILYRNVNLLTALCALAALLLYVFLYTIWLKPRTEQNIVIGGISGCVGPLIGYAALYNSLPAPSWILFLVIFLWTPPHFWALAIYLKDEYKSAEFPMMPVVSGIKKTVDQIFIYTIFYAASCMAFYFSGEHVGILYFLPALALSIKIIFISRKLVKDPSPERAKSFFLFSITHLFAINFLVVVDRFIK